MRGVSCKLQAASGKLNQKPEPLRDPLFSCRLQLEACRCSLAAWSRRP
ncbi:hypothetical protein C4K26_2883 [Pseudomonas chlororaphis]|nr:hypothetical protein C4K26_2883 [Pseudomonas chlororaphis]